MRVRPQSLLILPLIPPPPVPLTPLQALSLLRCTHAGQELTPTQPRPTAPTNAPAPAPVKTAVLNPFPVWSIQNRGPRKIWIVTLVDWLARLSLVIKCDLHKLEILESFGSYAWCRCNKCGKIKKVQMFADYPPTFPAFWRNTSPRMESGENRPPKRKKKSSKK